MMHIFCILLFSCTASLQAKKEPAMAFNFQDEDLTKVINLYAEKAGLNIMMPQGTAAITQKVTFKKPKKIPLSEARKFIDMFLDLAGYSMRPSHDGAMYTISKNDSPYSKEPLPLYVGILPEELPRSDEKIRAVYYLSNLKVPEGTSGNEPLSVILKDMVGPGGSYLFEPRSNAIIIAERANTIASIMKIVLELDTYGAGDVIEIVPLFNCSATTVEKLLNEQILKARGQDEKTPFRGDVRSDSGVFFSTNIRVIADDRTNSLIIMGRETSVERLKEFIHEYIDAAQESGKSILHVYDLQYLDAKDFAKVLKTIVTPQGKSGQSTKEMSGDLFFDGVQIIAESYEESSVAGAGLDKTKGQSAEQKVYTGGNRLVITAREKDWERIKTLIRQLDRPERQIVIEVLIVDISLVKKNKVGGQARNTLNTPRPDNMQAQVAELSSVVTDQTTTALPETTTTLMGDLLRLGPSNTRSLAKTLTDSTLGGDPGSLIISFKDPASTGIWGLLQILQAQTDIKVLSHPFLVTKNNAHAYEKVSNIRRIPGDVNNSGGGITRQNIDDVAATLEVSITPRTNSLERLGLQIAVEISNFQSTIDNTRTNRRVQTNANMSSGEVLVLGGLTRVEDSTTKTKIPVLGDIPIIKWFFSQQVSNLRKTNLAIFICPTVVEPKLRQGLSIYTCDKIQRARNTFEEGSLFDSLDDPITHFFFRNRQENIAMVDGYLVDGNIESYDGAGACAPIKETPAVLYKEAGCSNSCEKQMIQPDKDIMKKNVESLSEIRLGKADVTATEKKIEKEKSIIPEAELSESEKLKQLFANEKNPLFQAISKNQSPETKTPQERVEEQSIVYPDLAAREAAENEVSDHDQQSS